MLWEGSIDIKSEEEFGIKPNISEVLVEDYIEVLKKVVK